MLDTYKSVIHKSRYARYLDEEKRRETFEETITRYINFMYKTAKNTKIFKEDLHNLYIELGATCEE